MTQRACCITLLQHQMIKAGTVKHALKHSAAHYSVLNSAEAVSPNHTPDVVFEARTEGKAEYNMAKTNLTYDLNKEFLDTLNARPAV